MKETIYTIPINDAFDKNCECAVCEFLREEEKKLIEYTVGASMMEPDVREVTNEKGFCNKHFFEIYNTPNKLSCALVAQTHTEEIIKKLKGGYAKLSECERGFFRKKDGFDVALNSETAAVAKINSSCAVCERLDDIAEKFLKNVLYLYDTEEEFKQKFLNSKGFCLVHFEKLLKCVEKNLNGRKKEEFAKMLYELEIKHFERNKSDLDNFIKKFDHRYIHTEFENSRDALVRTTQKIAGYFENEK